MYKIEARKNQRYARWKFVSKSPNLMEAEIEVDSLKNLCMYIKNEFRVKYIENNEIYIQLKSKETPNENLIECENIPESTYRIACLYSVDNITYYDYL